MTTTRLFLIRGMAAAGITLAAWFALGIFPAGILNSSDTTQHTPTSRFVLSASPDTEGVYIDLSSAQSPDPEFVSSPESIVHLGSGWSVAEDWGIWALGESATMHLFFEQHRERTMLIRSWAPKHPERIRQTITVSVNGHKLGSLPVTHRPRNRYIHIPSSVQKEGRNLIRFDFAFSSSPAASGLGADTRALAVGFCAIGIGDPTTRIKPPSLRSEVLQSIKLRLGIHQPAAELDVATGTITVRRPGTVVLPVPISYGDRHVQLRIRSSGRPSSPLIPRITATPLDGGAAVDLDLQIKTESEKVLSTLVSFLLPTGLKLPAILEIEFNPHSEVYSAASPLFKSDQNDQRLQGTHDPPTPASQGESATIDRPDLVVITLDAARPDHFGCYGYHRPTTPNIDEFAADSIVFDQAFALAPFTLCSVPTMISGLSFLDHGVVSRGQRLNSHVTTLAEHLARLGYETGAFSATPNNSRALGFDQGYGTFWEAWQGVAEHQARDPRRLSSAVVDWLDTIDEEQPLHLQVHYVPPHEPYDPGPTFDIFSNPDYDGPVDGHLPAIKAIDRGDLNPSSNDITQLIDLYDGNLRRADEAVGIVLRALQKRRRWANTVVLVTSDHGEAFFEHHRLGHNSTLYDEMLRVPFILRLPGGFDGPPEGTPVTLADIVPTLVPLAGPALNLPRGGSNLLSVSRDLSKTWSFVARTDRKVPVTAIRTERWKLIRTSHHRMQLFDVVADPGEHTDVLHREFPIAVGMDLLLLQELRSESTYDADLSNAPVDADDAAMLEALGYTQ